MTVALSTLKQLQTTKVGRFSQPVISSLLDLLDKDAVVGAGTMFISEVGFQLYLHELVPTPQPELRQILQIPGPEPESDEKEEHYVAACWAPDGSAVLLHYSIKLFSEEVGYQVWCPHIVALGACLMPHPLAPSSAAHCPAQCKADGTMACPSLMPQSCMRPQPLTVHSAQVVYLLELQPALSGAQKEVTRIVKFDDDCLLKQFSFTLTSGLILVMVMNPWRLGDREGHDLSVYDRSGQLIARFEDDDLSVPAHFSDGCLAHAVGERVAAARATSFAVWDLRSGRKLGVRGPWPEQSPHEAGMAAGQVVANRTGSSLAFCGTGSLDVHLFDAVSLEAQGTVRLAGSELLAHLQSVGGQLASIVWAAGGFLLQTRDVTHTHDLVHMLGLHFLKSQPGSSSSPRERLRCSPKEWRGWSVQDGMQPALTSDGAFVAMYEHASRTVEVWDTCSGRKAHTQAIVVPEQVEAKYTHRGYAVLSWGSSGLALLLRVGSGGSGELADQITLMQF